MLTDLSRDYRWSIDYDPIGHHECESHGCYDEGICRCYTIDEVIINSVNVYEISESIFSQLFDVNSLEYKRNDKLNQLLFGISKDVEMYCIDRILRINKIYNIENWDASWSSGYYGEEIDAIKLVNFTFTKVVQDLNSLFKLNTLKEKINFLLEKEYGFILDKIKDKEYQIIEVNKSDIVFGQQDHKEMVDSHTYLYYSDQNYNLIRGICMLDRGKWKIIDGYHRINETKKDKVKIIGII
jgi:hypothetical protein